MSRARWVWSRPRWAWSEPKLYRRSKAVHVLSEINDLNFRIHEALISDLSQIINGTDLLEVLHDFPELKRHVHSLYYCHYDQFFQSLSGWILSLPYLTLSLFLPPSLSSLFFPPSLSLPPFLSPLFPYLSLTLSFPPSLFLPFCLSPLSFPPSLSLSLSPLSLPLYFSLSARAKHYTYCPVQPPSFLSLPPPLLCHSLGGTGVQTGPLPLTTRPLLCP